MASIKTRKYNCKDEELPVICGFANYSLTRDQADFFKYSSTYNENYRIAFEAKIAQVKELVAPHSEMALQKIITQCLYSSMNDLVDTTSRLTGYIEMAYETLRISTEDFGITGLRKALHQKDPEGVLRWLREVNANIITYNDVLAGKGLTEELSVLFTEGINSISDDLQARYQINSKRKIIIQANIGTFNGLYANLCGILSAGKILYQHTNSVKEKEYSFRQLMKSIRKASASPAEPTDEADLAIDKSAEIIN